MKHEGDERWDDALDGVLRLRAEELRTNELARSDTDEAWTRFVREGEHDTTSSRAPRAPRAIVRRRPEWVPVIAAGLVAAAILALVWLSSRPAAKQPIDLDETTTVSATSTTADTSTTLAPSTTVATPVAGPPAVILPTFPDGKVIASLAAVSDSEWFALSDFGPPGRQSYNKLWHTTDGGATWVEVPHPQGTSGQLHFADPLNGWLIENQASGINATHDGGASWALLGGVTARGGAEGPAIAFADGRVHIFGDVPIEGNSRIGVMSSPVGSDQFVWSGETMGDARWGLTPSSSQLVIRGDVGWAIAYGVTAPPRSTPSSGTWPPGALRLIDGEWKAWDPPCAASLQGKQAYTNIEVPRLLLDASSSGGNVAIVCQETGEGSPLRTFVSDDRGATFVEGGQLPDGVTMTDRSWVRVLDDGAILLGAALDTGDLVVERSDDSGRSWTVDTSFGGVGDFATMTVTPSGRIVLVATVVGSDGVSRDVGRWRDERGLWFPLGTK